MPFYTGSIEWRIDSLVNTAIVSIVACACTLVISNRLRLNALTSEDAATRVEVSGTKIAAAISRSSDVADALEKERTETQQILDLSMENHKLIVQLVAEVRQVAVSQEIGGKKK